MFIQNVFEIVDHPVKLIIGWTAYSFSPSCNKARDCLNSHNMGKKRQLIQVTEPFNVPIMCDNCNFLNDVGVARCLGVALVRFENPTPLHHRLIGQLCAAKTDGPGSFMALYNSNLMVDVITQYEPLPHWLPAAFSFLHSLIGRWLHEKNKTQPTCT